MTVDNNLQNSITRDTPPLNESLRVLDFTDVLILT
jgi:hypothetical protein